MAPPKKPPAAAPPVPAPVPEPPAPEPPVEEPAPAPEAEAAPQDGEQEIVAVGTVSHVIRRAFHHFYTDPEPHSTAAEPVAVVSDAVPPADNNTPQETTGEPQVPEDATANAVEEPAVHPYVALGDARKQLLSDSLTLTQSTASALLAFLDERYSAAAAQDEAIAVDLARQGLVVHAQIPMGPSNLQLDASELAPFGAFADTLVHAKTLVRDYHAERLDKSGNGPAFLARKVAGITREPPGYLGTTSSYDVRKQTTLTVHEHNIQTVKAAATASIHAPKSDSTEDTPEEPDDSTESSAKTVRFSQDDVMPAHERRKNMAILERMQTKLDFLRNPRYAAAPSSSGKESTPIFEAVPSPVVFTDYDVGGVYEQTFVVRNTSALSRRVRVLPPATLYFSVAQIAFPDASGLVAPGMHVLVRLRFAPDSRADYKDAMTIQYEGASAASSEFVLPVLARRAPPELSIPLLLRAQPTLVGTQSVTTIPCTNTGGKARFWLMSERDWARCEATAFRAGGASGTIATVLREFMAQGGALRVGAFTVAPHEMELATSETVALQLTFLPSGVGEQRDKFVMVCDNCLVRVFQLVGRGCQVDVSVTALNAAQPIDRSIAHMGRVAQLVFAQTLLLNATQTQRLTVANDTPVALPFTWRLESDRADPICPFAITPSRGVLPASDALAFTVAFSPPTARRFAHWRLVLDINDVPPCSLPGPQQLGLLGETLPRLREAAQTQLLGKALVAPLSAAVPAVEAMRVALHGTGRLGDFHLSPAVVSVLSEQQQEDDTTLLSLGTRYRVATRVWNDCDARISVRWDVSRARVLPGLPATSGSNSSDLFELSLDVAELELQPNASADVVLAFTPRAVGRFVVVVPCAIVDPHDASAAGVTRWLRLEGAVARPQLRVASREIDFGLVLASASADAMLSLCNDSRVAAGDWTLVHVEAPTPIAPALAMEETPLRRASSKDSLASSARGGGGAPSTTRSSTGSLALSTARDLAPRASVSFSPPCGRLGPGETVDVRVTCQSGSLPERFRGTFALRLASPVPTFPSVETTDKAAAGSCVSARAEIQSPNVFLSPLRLALGTTFLGVRVERELLLVNVSNLEAAFKFVEPAGTSRACGLELSPRQGVLLSKQTLRVRLSYTPKQAGKTTTLLACSVQGLAAPLGLEVVSTHKGLVLTYDVLDGDETVALPPAPSEIALARGVSVADGELEPPDGLAHAVPKLLFGDALPLTQRRALRLVVRNFSGIDALLEMEPKRFRAAAWADPEAQDNDDEVSSRTASGGLLSRSSRATSTSPTATSQKKRKTKPLLSDARDAARRFQSPAGRAFIRTQDHTQQDRALLRDGRGVAFLVHGDDALTPLEGALRVPPWGRAVVSVTCFNNMPGAYSDVLSCRALGLPPVLLPMQATVVGSPLVLDANCVGLRLRGACATLSFGHVCVRAPAVTKTLRVFNRGPRAARLNWKLVDPAREHQRVQVALRVAFDARVRLRITSLEPDADAFPFELSPPHALPIAPFASAAVRVTFFPSDAPSAARALLVADAHWLDDDNMATLSPSTSSASTLELVDESLKASVDPRCEPPHSASPRLATAAGKAIQAVRVANSLARASPAAVQSAVSVSASCLRVLLRASVVAPELALDQTPRVLGSHHVKFTTWATLLASPDAWHHAFHRRELSLVNRLTTRMTFRLEATGAFAVTRAESLAPRHPLAAADLPAAHRRADGESFLFTLPPQMAVRVELRVDTARLSLPPKADANALTQRVEGELLVRFTNQSVQTLRLACDVLRARLVASPAVHGFGRVHLSQTRTLVLRVANPTRVPATFQVRHVPRPTPLTRAQKQEMAAHHAHFVDEPGVFTFAMDRGVVRGPTVSLRSAGGAPQPKGHSTRDLYELDDAYERLVFAALEIVVTFRPREIGKKYRSRFRLCVDAGVDCEVVLQGQGHLDEVQYDDQDRPMARASELTHQNLIFKTLSPVRTTKR